MSLTNSTLTSESAEVKARQTTSATLRVFAPASIGNYLAGFDTLGMAVRPVDGPPMGDIVELSPAAQPQYLTHGPYAHLLPPRPEEDLSWLSREAYHQELAARGGRPQPLRLVLDKRLPICSGLGSSSASIIATLFALNCHYGEALSVTDLLRLAGRLEARGGKELYYDNVCPSLLGGLQLTSTLEKFPCRRLAPPRHWHYVLHYPGSAIATRDARGILPPTFPLAAVTRFAQRQALIVHALLSEREDELAVLLHDELVEPHREKLITGFPVACEAALAAGAVAFGIAGSGPAVVAVCPDRSAAEEVQATVAQVMPNRPGWFSRICLLDDQGARKLEE